MIRRLVFVLFVAALLAGCSGERDRNVNRDRDRPKSAGEKVEKDKAP